MFAKWQNNFRTILSFSFKVIISDRPHQTEPNGYNEIIIVTMKFINLASRNVLYISYEIGNSQN